MSRIRSSPFVLDAVEEFLRTKRAREPKTYAAYRGVLLRVGSRHQAAAGSAARTGNTPARLANLRLSTTHPAFH